MSTAMKATAEGSFQKTPFSNVLLYARERKMTGSLVITIPPEGPGGVAATDAAGLSTLVLENGSIVAVHTPSEADTLSWVLHDTGALSEDAFVQVQEAVAKPGSGDEVATLLRLRLADMGGIEKGLRELARRRVLGLFGFPGGTYAYYANVDLLAGSGRLRAPEDVLPIVWRGFHKYPPDTAAVAAVIDKLGGRALRLREQNEFDRFEFGDELGLAPTQLRSSPSSLDQLMGLSPDPGLVRRMVYLLALTKQVEVAPVGAGAAASVSAPPGVIPSLVPKPPPVPPGARLSSPEISRPPPVPPAASARPSSPEVAAVPPPTPEKPDPTNHPKWKEAAAHLSKLEHKNYFEMFELAETATTEDVKGAFPKAAAPWHPDRAPIPELRAMYEEIFSLYNAAHSTLVDKSARQQYEETLHGGGGTPAAQRQVAAVLDTVQDVHRAEIALKRRDYPEAERLLRRTLAASSSDVAASILLAQCLMEVDPVKNAGEVLNLMSEVCKATEGNDRAFLYLGLALKAQAHPRARGAFMRALEINPNNIEASRELRIIDMRREQRREEKAAEKSLGGLFNKLLKK